MGANEPCPQPRQARGFLLSGGRVASKYGHEHRKVRAQYQRLIDAGQGCHDPSGTKIIGPGHARCNESEAAKRGNAIRQGVTTLAW